MVLLGACGDQDGAGSGPADPGEPAAAARPKVAVFGVDGATFTVMRSLLAEGRLPHMAGLIERGTGMVLRKMPAEDSSPVLWNTLMTGTLPATHGILNFGKRVDGVLSVYASGDRRAPALWNLVDARGGTSGVVGMWNTWPAEPVAGYVVSDRFARSLYMHNYREGLAATGVDPAWGITHPAELAGELAPFALAPDAIVRADVEQLGTFSDAEWEELLAGDKRGATTQGNGLVALKYGWQATESVAAASLHLLRTREQPDLFITFLELPDRVGHHFWHAWQPEAVQGGPDNVEPEWLERWAEVVPRSYERVDWWIGQMLAELDEDTTVLVVSDHGMRSSGSPGGRLTDLARVHHSGTHDDEGILLAAGPAIRPGARARATIADVAPLVLVALGLPRSTGFEGHLPRPLLDPDFLRAHPLRPPVADTLSAVAVPEEVDVQAVDGQLIQALEAIGYTGASGELLADEGGAGPGSGARRGPWVEPCSCCTVHGAAAHCTTDTACADCAACPACRVCEAMEG